MTKRTKRQRRPPGRPSKFGPEVAKRLLNLLRAGVSARRAARAVGIGEATYFRWLEAGAAPRARREFREFREQAEAAADEGVARVTVRLNELIESNAVPPATRLAAITFYLARRAPEEWGPAREMEAPANDKAPAANRYTIVFQEAPLNEKDREALEDIERRSRMNDNASERFTPMQAEQLAGELPLHPHRRRTG